MIDPKTGLIHFSDALQLAPRMHVADIKTPIRKMAPQSMSGMPLLIGLGQHAGDDCLCSVTGMLEDDRLQRVWLRCLNAPGMIQVEWCIATEIIRHAVHSHYLLMQLGTESAVLPKRLTMAFEFGWGRVTSDLDVEGMQAAIGVSFNALRQGSMNRRA